MENNSKTWVSTCFLMLAGVFCSCSAVGKPPNTSLRILNNFFSGQVSETGTWVRVEEKSYPAFYREMPVEYKRLNPAEAYLNESFHGGLLVIYGKVADLNVVPKVCIMEASAIYYSTKGPRDAVPLVEKSYYAAWERKGTDKKCGQSPPLGYTLIESGLPIAIMEKILVNENTLLNKCFDNRDKKNVILGLLELNYRSP